MGTRSDQGAERLVHIPAGSVSLAGDLAIPPDAQGLVLFAHGSGSSRRSSRNRYVAEVLRDAGLATLLFDLLTPAEEQAERLTRHLRFDIDLLAQRLDAATRWVRQEPTTRELRTGYFGASTGAAAALVAAAHRPAEIAAVVSRGGRPDLAGESLLRVLAPTLLIVGSLDTQVIGLNQEALAMLHTVKRLEIVPGASHLFEEPGTLEQAARLARQWFVHYLTPTGVERGAHEVAGG